MTRKDQAGLADAGLSADRLTLLPPFLDTAPFVAASRLRDSRAGAGWRRLGDWTPRRPWLLAVAMMRADVKLASYEILAPALGRILALGLATDRGRRG